MWESPIKISTIIEEIERKVTETQEEYIYGQVRAVVDVDKDELVKALAYDRDQYEKGYSDGRMARDEEIIRCKDCEWYRVSDFDAMSLDCTVYKRHCKQVDKLVKPDFFCGWAERSKDA